MTTPAEQIAALTHGLETTAANLRFQQERCNELTGAIRELVRRNLIAEGMLETLLKALIAQHPYQVVRIARPEFEAAARLNLQRKDEGGIVSLCLVEKKA